MHELSSSLTFCFLKILLFSRLRKKTVIRKAKGTKVLACQQRLRSDIDLFENPCSNTVACSGNPNQKLPFLRFKFY